MSFSERNSNPITYPCLRSILGFSSVDKRRLISASIPETRTPDRVLPYIFENVYVDHWDNYNIYIMYIDEHTFIIKYLSDEYVSVNRSDQNALELRMCADGFYQLIKRLVAFLFDRNGTVITNLRVRTNNRLSPDYFPFRPQVQIFSIHLTMTFNVHYDKIYKETIKDYTLDTFFIDNNVRDPIVFKDLAGLNVRRLEILTPEMSDLSLTHLDFDCYSICEHTSSLSSFIAHCRKLASNVHSVNTSYECILNDIYPPDVDVLRRVLTEVPNGVLKMLYEVDRCERHGWKLCKITVARCDCYGSRQCGGQKRREQYWEESEAATDHSSFSLSSKVFYSTLNFK
ncbi:unnamed protein product [Caenorhabditis sp. 36 PRJEB53466]|nr:unnamed protein product [Caenorhabditis sp. 36 PRJEB53466]